MQIKIISANIRFENANDGTNCWSNRLPLLQKVFTEFSPHILATQEGREQQIKSLAAALPLKLVEHHREWIAERMYPCLYVNEEFVNVLNSGDIWLSETPHVKGSVSFKSAFPRLCTWMHIFHYESKQEYIVINTHLDHILEETRCEQINVLIKEINLINHKNLPLILIGDFNDSPYGHVRKIIDQKLFLKDPWQEKQRPEETTHHAFRGEKAAGGERIDWILVSNEFEVLDIKLDKRSFNDIYPSDHYPLLATLMPK